MYLKDRSIQIAKNILIRFPKSVIRFFGYVNEFIRFRSKKDKRFTVKFKDAYPCLKDKIRITPFDQHYVYHPAWAARILAKTKPEYHVDISSLLAFSTIVSAFVPVKFYDYRPAHIQLPNLETGAADLTNLFFDDNSIPSISCMHTVEHIGLGRYGDKLDPGADIKSVNELIRVTRPQGDILFVTPVGKQRIEFNAHPISSFETVIKMFIDCRLMEFSLIPDSGGLIINADPNLVRYQTYGCGCFWFKKL